jgi:hypothetical protein
LIDKSDDKSFVAGNRCDNSYSPRSGFIVEERIVKLIDESEIELVPYEVARRAHVKRSTVRVILRKLLDRGLILQPYSGACGYKIIHGMRFMPLCVHNVSLWFFAGTVSHWEKDELVGGVKIHVCFGQERRKVSGYIACDAGMSHDACLLALNRGLTLLRAG